MGERERRLASLSTGQRVKRRLKLLGGSYTWPDGMIELDFEEPAGIDPWDDDQQTQERKLDRYGAGGARRSRQGAGVFFAAAAVLFATHAGMPTWEVVAAAALVFVGTRFLAG